MIFQNVFRGLDIHEKARCEARNKLEKLVIEMNNKEFLMILDDDRKKKFLEFAQNVKFFHDNSQQEYEHYYEQWTYFFKESRYIAVRKQLAEKRKAEQLERIKEINFKAQAKRQQEESLKSAEQQKSLELDAEVEEEKVPVDVSIKSNFLNFLVSLNIRIVFRSNH
jgi:hypothetical protein